MKIQVNISIRAVFLTVLSLDSGGICLHVLGQVADKDPSCNQTCSYNAEVKYAECKNRYLDTIPRECSATVYLDFRRNNLQYIDLISFSGYEHLRYVYLENNNIGNITPRAFSACPEIRYLYLQNNPLVYLQQYTFFGASRLTQLYLTDTSLEAIEGGTFTGLSSLQRLFLNNNRLRTLPENAFHNLRTLEILSLSNNLLQTLHSDQFKGLHQLTNLDLQENQLTRLESGLFQGLVSLNELNVSHNAIAQVQPGALEFTKLVNLGQIDMSYNNIATVQNFSTGMAGVAQVFLAGNPIHCGCRENKALVDWYKNHLLQDPSIATDSRYDVICTSPQQLNGLALKNGSGVLDLCKDFVHSAPTDVKQHAYGDNAVEPMDKNASSDVLPIVAISRSNATTQDDLYMIVGIAVLLLCVAVVVVISVGVYIKCKRRSDARNPGQASKEDTSMHMSASTVTITENPTSEEWEDDMEKPYEEVTIQPTTTGTGVRRLRLISEKSQDSAFCEGSSIDSPESDDAFHPSFPLQPPPPPPPPPPHGHHFVPVEPPPSYNYPYAQPGYTQAPSTHIPSVPTQLDSTYIPVFQNPNGMVYLCTQCPHVHQNAQQALTHSKSVPDYHAIPESHPSNQMHRQNSFPQKNQPQGPSRAESSQRIYEATPEQSNQHAPDSNVQVTSATPLLDSQTQDAPHEDCPPVPLQTNINVSSPSGGSTNVPSSSHIRQTNHPRRVSFSDDVSNSFKA